VLRRDLDRREVLWLPKARRVEEGAPLVVVRQKLAWQERERESFRDDYHHDSDLVREGLRSEGLLACG
jgi:hypothetical protein